VVDMDKCPVCNSKMQRFKHVPSALDDVVCPRCGCRDDIGFWIPPSLGSCDVDCKCGVCSHTWSVHVVLPKNLFG